MKKHFLITALLIAAFLRAGAQKENYFSLESGVYFGKANANIASGMTQSGLADMAPARKRRRILADQVKHRTTDSHIAE